MGSEDAGVPLADVQSELDMLREDMEELVALQKQAKRAGALACLQKGVAEMGGRVAELEKLIASAEKAKAAPEAPAATTEEAAGGRPAAAAADDGPPPPPAKPVPELSKHATLATYSWTESAKSVKIYCDLKNLKDARGDVDCSFSGAGFTFWANDVPVADGGSVVKSWRLAVPNLCEGIAVAKSSLTRKDHKFVITLWKLHQGSTWEHLTDVERLKKQKHKELVDGGATTDQLLANMFQNADAETQAKLREAALEGQKKREATAKQQGL